MHTREPREDFRHLKAAYDRWMEGRNRKQESPDYKDDGMASSAGDACFGFL